MANAINWFEIPTHDLERAKRFYETVLDITMMPMDGPRPMAAFPADWSKGELSGCIVQGEGAVPTRDGVTLFLSCGRDLAPALERVDAAGGKVLMPKTKIPMQDAGHMAFMLDSEGNRMGLHSPE